MTFRSKEHIIADQAIAGEQMGTAIEF